MDWSLARGYPHRKGHFPFLFSHYYYDPLFLTAHSADSYLSMVSVGWLIPIIVRGPLYSCPIISRPCQMGIPLFYLAVNLSYLVLRRLKSSGKREWYSVCAQLSVRKRKGEDHEGPDETFRDFTSATESWPVHFGTAEKEAGRLCFTRSELSGFAVCPAFAPVKKPANNGPGMSDIIRWIIGKLLGPFVPEPVPIPVEPVPHPKPKRRSFIE